MERTYVEFRRTAKKPFPTKGAWTEENGYKGSPATRATLIKNGEEWYEVQVYNLRGAWCEGSEPSDDLKSFSEAKKWLIDNYGGKWVKD